MVKAVKTGLNSNTTTNNKNNNKTSTSTCAPNNTQSKKIETYEIPKSTPSYTNTCASSNTYSNPVTYTANTSSGSITAISSNVDSYSSTSLSKTSYTNTCASSNTYSNKIETYDFSKTNPKTSYTNTCASSNTYSNNTTLCGVANTHSNRITSIRSSIDKYYTDQLSNKQNQNDYFKNTNINISYSTSNYKNYLLPDLNISLEDYLKEKNMTIDNLNNIIKERVEKAGTGTGDGVVAAGKTLADFLSAQGVKLPYISSTGLSGLASGKYSELGANKDWGTQGEWYSIGYNKNYYNSGLDCSGFLSWALHNGGYKYDEYHSSQFENLGTKREFDSNGKAGDILWKDGHVAMITDVNKNGYTILHETENDEIDKQVEGLIYTHTDFTGKDKETTKQFTHIIDMSEYYNNPANLEN